MKLKVQNIFLPIYLAFCLLSFIMVKIDTSFLTIPFSFIQYSCIVFGFVISFIFRNKETIFITIGLFFTLCADFFLVPKINIHGYIIFSPLGGMISFSLMQISYAIYLFLSQDIKYKKIHIIFRSIASILGIIFPLVLFQQDVDMVVILTGFYVANFIVSIIFAFINYRKNSLFAIGLTLFILCDIATGLASGVELGYLSIPEGSLISWIAFPGFNLGWIFYIPAQVLIVLSSIPNFKKNLSKIA